MCCRISPLSFKKCGKSFHFCFTPGTWSCPSPSSSSSVRVSFVRSSSKTSANTAEVQPFRECHIVGVDSTPTRLACLQTPGRQFSWNAATTTIVDVGADRDVIPTLHNNVNTPSPGCTPCTKQTPPGFLTDSGLFDRHHTPGTIQQYHTLDNQRCHTYRRPVFSGASIPLLALLYWF